MHLQVENVTPELATAYLSQNTNNRPLNQRRVQSYVNAMMRGEWQFNGDPVRFDSEGVLIDGQHRLSAIEQSGIAQKILIIRDLPRTTFQTIDIGAKRSAGDLAALSGVKNTSTVTSGARLYLTWVKTGSIYATVDKAPSNQEILDFVVSSQLAARAAAYIHGSASMRRLMAPSVACFLYLAFSTVSEEKAIQFLNEVKEPTSVDWESPSFLLRERIIQSSMTKAKLKKNEMVALVMKAWRHWMIGQKVKILKVSTSGATSEKNIYRVK